MRYKDIVNEEARAYDPSKAKPLEIPAHILDNYKVLLLNVAGGFVKTSNPHIIVKWFAISGDENRLRTFLKMVSTALPQPSKLTKPDLTVLTTDTARAGHKPVQGWRQVAGHEHQILVTAPRAHAIQEFP